MFSLLHPQTYDTPLFSFIDRQPSIGLNEPSSPSSRAEYYRHLADQHERIAQLASARAREQQERNAELERQRMAALLHHGHSNEPSSHPPPRYPEDGLHPHNTLPLSTHLQEPSSGYGSSAGINHHHLPSDEEQFLNYLLARREARLNEEERIRREAAAARERQEYEARDRALLQLLRRLGTDRQQEEDNNPITHTPSGHNGVLEQVARQPTHSFSQVPTLLRAHEPRHQASIENPIDRLWSSWASQLSDDDKATVLESFGVSVPRTVTNTQRQEHSLGARDAVRLSAGANVPCSPPRATPSVSVPLTYIPNLKKSTDEHSSESSNEAPASIVHQPFTLHQSTTLMDSISAIKAKFEFLRALFRFPPRLEFSPNASGPMLLHNSSNAPFIRYENDLTKLLTKLDEIESHGDEHLREMRKWLVDAIEWELEELDRRKMEEWKRIQSAKAPVPSELEHKDILKEPEERVDVTPIGDCAVSDSDEVPDRVDDKTPVPTIVVTLHNPEVMTRSNVGADAATVTEPSPSNPAPTPSAGDKIAVDAAECRDRSEEKH